VDNPPAIRLLLSLTLAVLSACGRSESADALSARTSPAKALSAATVQLSESQLSSVTVEPVGTYAFPLEKEAVGAVSFDEDLPVIQAESALMAASAAYDLTSKERVRVQGLAGSNGLSTRELEQAMADQQTAASTLRAARDAVRALGKTDAEIDRLIASRQMPAPQVHGSTTWVLAHVTESDSPYVHVGQRVTARAMALPGRAFAGRVSRVYAAVDPETHRVSIRCQVADAKSELRPGMLLDVVLRVGEPFNAVAMPIDGVVREGDGSMTVWVTTDHHRFSQRRVELGLQQDGRYQIVNGLHRGELAVTEGAVFLSNMLQAPPSD